MLVAAIAEFAVTGYHGTPTEAIARRAGISQPYLFRLYGTKRDLFLACAERCFDRTLQCFRRATEHAADDERLQAMGRAYVELLEDRELLLFQLQTYAAADDVAIRAVARRRYEELTTEVAGPQAFGQTQLSGSRSSAAATFRSIPWPKNGRIRSAGACAMWAISSRISP